MDPIESALMTLATMNRETVKELEPQSRDNLIRAAYLELSCFRDLYDQCFFLVHWGDKLDLSKDSKTLDRLREAFDAVDEATGLAFEIKIRTKRKPRIVKE